MKAGLWMVLVVLCLSCSQGRQGPLPVVEQTSVTVLREQVDHALAELAQLEARVPSEAMQPGETQLRRIRTALEHLRYFYLPMLEAREDVSNAMHLYWSGRKEACVQRLEDARRVLMEAAGHGNGEFLRAMEQLSEQTYSLKQMVSLDDTRAASRFEQLLRSLNLKTLRGQLIIGGQEL